MKLKTVRLGSWSPIWAHVGFRIGSRLGSRIEDRIWSRIAVPVWAALKGGLG